MTPRKVRDLVKDLRKAGFSLLPGRGKGSHRIYEHPAEGVPQVRLSGKLNADALPYQERDAAAAVSAANAARD